jgi:nicotinamide-nucleotide amidase
MVQTGSRGEDGSPAPGLPELPVADLANRLQEQGLRLCTAESCTGGLIAARLTDMPGSSAWFECGWVTYSNASKTHMLGVAPDLLERCGAVSASVAEAMAKGALAAADADLAVAVTGIAGPSGGSRDKPVGLVWFAWARRGGGCRSAERVFPGSREQVRVAAAAWCLHQLLKHELARD